MDSSALAFTYLFCALLVGGLIVRTVLASRQIRHVVRHRDQVPEPFAATIGLDAHRKAADYTVAKARFGMLESAIEAALLLGWTLLGGLHALNQWLLQWMEPGMWQQLVLLGAFTLIGAVLTLPLGWWSTFRLEERFGFNKMSVGLWLGDLLKGAVVGALIGLPIAALVLWLMGAAGPAWWLWAWGAWMVFNIAILVLYPTVIAPLFNKFQPLADESLKARVQTLMARCGFQAKGLFVMDGSKRSAHANAYFTGMGSAKRVVFFDTLLSKLTPGEVEAVLAHELGHFKHKHVTKRMVSMFAMSLAGFALLGWLSGQAWFYTALGVQPSLAAPNDALALLLFLMVVPVFGFFISPLFAQLSRKHEFQADAYACAQSSGHDLAAALLKLHEDNASTLTPDPLYVRFYYSHPAALERLAAIQLQAS
jgi:STE24 endopeptidase